MSYQKRPKNVTMTSPRGIFRYPALTKPDFGTDEYPKLDGEYKVTLILTQEEAAPFLAKLEPLHEAAIANGREEFKKLKIEARKKLKDVTVQPLYTEEYDKETEEPTGRLFFNIKMAASGKSKKDGSVWTRKPALFDAKGKPMLKVPDIWGGTEGKVSFEVAPYFIPGTALAGIKLRLNAVQVIELRSGGNKSAGEYGFGEEEGGFDAESVAEQEQDEKDEFEEEEDGGESNTYEEDF
ncbi:DUF2815 domain-containing protein [Pseudomonas juntendi]|uniref:DUF2815 domain-containing protein n=1 Tax=Pseudomonas juntendi TaxID=2666183 RepID=UPI0018D78F16|nr:DUF2815 domain-containing protein [Pseudomonas juntendi]MBH3383811.1 DUF2815 domain-containing protein [Pseudomonas juntendi]